MYAVSGILFNHESPRRGLEFVTRKITHGGRADQARARRRSCAWATSTRERDWGFAGDYVRAMWLMLQQAEPDDYVDRHGRDAQRSASSCELAFAHVGLDWRDVRRRSTRRFSGRRRSTSSSATRRKAPRPSSAGSPRSAFEELVEMMVDADLALVARDAKRNPEERRLTPIEPLPVVS